MAHQKLVVTDVISKFFDNKNRNRNVQTFVLVYSRGPSKYTRKWEDESAYTKQSALQRNPRPEDFPDLGTRHDRRRRKSYQELEEKENKKEQSYHKQQDDENLSSHRRFSGNRSPIRRSQNDRYDNSRGQHQHPHHYERGDGRRNFSDNDYDNRRSNNERIDRDRDRDRNYRSGRNTVFKNQNRGKGNEHEGRSGNHSRNNSGDNKSTGQSRQGHQETVSLIFAHYMRCCWV